MDDASGLATKATRAAISSTERSRLIAVSAFWGAAPSPTAEFKSGRERAWRAAGALPGPESARSVEHDRLVPVLQHAVFQVEPDGTREDDFLQIPSLANQVVDRVAV